MITRFLILMLFFLVACSKFDRINENEQFTKIRFNHGSEGNFDTLSTQQGGVMIWGVSDRGMSFSAAMPDESLALERSLPNGNWFFYSMGWQDSNSPQHILEGVIRCGKTSATLDGTAKDISISIASANCNYPFFGSTDYTFSDGSIGNAPQFKPLRLITCATLTGVVNASSSCDSAYRGDIRSYKIKFMGFDPYDGSNGVNITSQLISGCFNVVPNSPLGNSSLTTPIKIPVGGTGSPLFTQISGFTQASCAGTKIDFTFPHGIAIAQNVNYLIYGYGSSTTAIFLQHGASLSAPTITNISPAVGTSAGGDTLTITGSNFNAVNSITIGGVTCSTPTGSSSSVSCITAAMSTGIKDVLLTNSDGQTATSSSFAVHTPPNLGSVYPSSGVAAGGDLIHLTGTGFASVSSITVGGVTCTPTNTPNSTSIDCITGTMSTGTKSILLTNGDGLTALLPASFTVTP